MYSSPLNRVPLCPSIPRSTLASPLISHTTSTTLFHFTSRHISSKVPTSNIADLESSMTDYKISLVDISRTSKPSLRNTSSTTIDPPRKCFLQPTTLLRSTHLALCANANHPSLQFQEVPMSISHTPPLPHRVKSPCLTRSENHMKYI